MFTYCTDKFDYLWGLTSRVLLVGLSLFLLSSNLFAAGTLEPPTLLRLGGDLPTVPLSFNDPVFASVTNSGALVLSSGAVISNLSITADGPQASVQCNGSCTLNKVRISSREAVRCVSGNLNLNSVWVEAKGVSGDHADGLQCYSPGSTGVNTIKNTTFRAYNDNATAGYFSADNWKGSHVFENVLFWGGPFGLRVTYDGGTAVSLKNVYFVKGSFMYDAFLFDPDSAGSGRHVPILQWDNVRWATIVNGQLVLGDLIPKPN